MVNLKEYLLSNKLNHGTYALVTYDGKEHPIWLTKYNFGDGDWFLESPCELYRITEVAEPVDEWAKDFVSGILEDDADTDEYVNEHVLPMIIDGVYYEIENFQCAPYLPKEIDDIQLISKRECLEYMLQHSKINTN